jgi:threonine dehydrogenase-like Zn-dependent dehydrogenase
MKNKTQPQLKQKLAKKTATIGIVGLGYVGLPLAIAFSQAGFKVLGFDTQSKKVNLINKGQSYITDISSKDLAAAVASKRFVATTAQSRLAEADVICICVPTPLTKAREPDLSYVIQASQTVAQHLRQGQLIILEINYDNVAPHIYVIRVKNGRRDGLKEYLKNLDIETGINYRPNHLHHFYARKKVSLPVTEKVYKEMLTIPLHCGLSDDDVSKVIQGVTEGLEKLASG